MLLVLFLEFTLGGRLGRYYIGKILALNIGARYITKPFYKYVIHYFREQRTVSVILKLRCNSTSITVFPVFYCQASLYRIAY